jgi:hypothetical protein
LFARIGERGRKSGASSLPPSKDDAGVDASETEPIRDRMLDPHAPDSTGDEVDPFGSRIAIFQIERGRRDLVASRADREDRFRSPGCAEQMTSRRFGGAHGNASVAAEYGFDRFQFGKVANRRRRGMRVEVLDGP